MTNTISPNVYLEIRDLVSYVQEVPGTVGLQFFLSEKGEDNTLIFANTLDMVNTFGRKNMKLYGQGLYNADNYQRYSTWLYVMRLLPNVEDNQELATPYVHPLAGQYILKQGSTASSGDNEQDVAEGRAVNIPADAIEPPATFAHATIGYVVDNTTDPANPKYGLMIRYKKPFGNDQDNIIKLDEDYGSVSRTYTFYISTSSLDETYNPNRLKINDTVASTTLEALNWQKLDIGSDGNGGLMDSANGFKTKYWNETEDPYYTGFNPSADSFVPLFTVFGIGRGSKYNEYSFTITKDLNSGNWFFTVYRFDPVSNSHVQVDAPYLVSFDPTAKDSSGESIYIANVINTWSKEFRVHVNAANMQTALATQVDLDGSGNYGNILDKIFRCAYDYNPGVSLYSTAKFFIELRNGSEGCLYAANGDRRSDIYAKILSEAYDGRHDESILNPFDKLISLTFDANFPQTVKEKIQTFCDKRGDTFGIIDMLRSSNASTTVTERNFVFNTINSWRVALYAPHGKMYSAEEGQEIVVSPSYHLSYLFPKNDKFNAIWYAPAGLVNGRLEDSMDLDYDVGITADMDRFTLSQINPIKTEFGTLHVGHQMTAQRYPGALTNINIARTIMYISRVLRRSGKYYLFRLTITPDNLKVIEDDFKEFLKEMKIRGAIQSYSVSVSSTRYETKNKIARAFITIVPTYLLERLFITIDITE